MDLSLTDEDVAFRDEVRGWIAENLTEEMRDGARLTTGPFSDFRIGMKWFRTLASRGWSAATWPTEFGGPGWSPLQLYIFNAECAAAGTPVPLVMGVQMVGPVLMHFGTPKQQEYYLPRILSGEDIWCQGYSEPGSGSDLASLKTRAVRDGDDYIINGSKIWTTFAQHANRMFCLVRTSTDGKAQEGISFILIDDFDAPGITVDPIITMAGDHEVNQVFFEDVRVPASNLVGRENDGWTVAKYLLEFERGGTYSQGLKRGMEKVRQIASEEQENGERVADDPVFRKKVADADTLITAMEYTELRVLGRLAGGQNPGPESSMIKCRGSELQQLVSELAFEAAGIKQTPFQPLKWGSNEPPIGPDWAAGVGPKMYNYRKVSIYAGSNEIQRNIMAKLILGL